MLGDATTGSSQPPANVLGNVVIKDCLFTDCAGSWAFRGNLTTPTEKCTITGNKWVYTDTALIHNLFWSAVEINNCRHCIVTDNEFAGARVVANERGFLQVWSRADVHFVYEFQRNKVSGLDYLVQLAAVATFYSPDQHDRRLIMRSEPGAVTDVLFGMSLHYPWDSGVWAPEDAARFPTAPATDWADSLDNQS
jgi:hypothetical protein